MEYTKGEWKAHCLGSEGYQVRRNNEGILAAKTKGELKERLTPIVERMGGSFETQRANANLIASAPKMYEVLKALMKEYWGGTIPDEIALPVWQAASRILNKAEGKDG